MGSAGQKAGTFRPLEGGAIIKNTKPEKLMKLLITILLAIASTIAFGQNEIKTLRKAYKKKDNTQLYQFFKNWENEVQPISETEWEKLNAIQKETYHVFKAFYQPDRIDLLGGSEWGNDIYKEAKFLIVQDFIEIFSSEKVYYTENEKEDLVADFINLNIDEDSTRQKLLKRDEDGKLSKEVMDLFGTTEFLTLEFDHRLVDSISDFRPPINSENKQPLYLTRKYSDILYAFLGNRTIPLRKDGMMKPARSKGKSEKRKQFLETYIKIWQGHWGKYWQLHSYPMAIAITFDQKMDFAKVDFRMIYEGGEAILKKEDGNWILVTAYRTWIE